jgi:hypothetical protein
MRRAAVLALVVSAPILLIPARAALGHEGEEEVPARKLVQQAIALLRGQPEQADAIEDKIADALAAEDAKGVDLDLVEQASRAFEAGRLHEAQDLLEEAIGAAPHRVVASPNPEPGVPAPPAVEAEAPPAPEAGASPVLHETEVRGSDQEWANTPRPILLGFAAALALLGLVVARRAR